MSAPYYTPQRYSSSTRPGAGKSASASAAAAAAAAGGKGGRIVPASAPGFTATMRDRQARGKDPYAANDSASDSDLDFDDLDTHSPSARGRGRGSSGSGSGGGVGKLGHLRGGGGSGGAGAGGNAGGAAAAAAAAAAAGAGRRIPPGETYESQRRKEWAIGILEDPEKLAMYACSRGDSIAGTRLYFTRQLCGLDETPTAPQQGLGKASSSSSSSASSRRDPQQRGERVVRC